MSTTTTPYGVIVTETEDYISVRIAPSCPHGTFLGDTDAVSSSGARQEGRVQR